MSTAIIQGASGSLGSHFARHLLSRTSLQIIATSRNPDAARQAILGNGGGGEGGNLKLDEDRLTVLKVDVKDERSIEDAAKEVRKRFGEGQLRLLINTSGVLHADKSITQVNVDELLEQYQLNTFGHLLTYKHFLPLLPRNIKTKQREQNSSPDPASGILPPGLSILASLTARVGSISDNQKGGWVGYRSSKAATNQIIKTLQRELEVKATPSIAVALHPGTVVGTNLSRKWTKEEDAGQKEGVFKAEESTDRLLKVLGGLGKEDGGRFLDWAGKEVKW